MYLWRSQYCLRKSEIRDPFVQGHKKKIAVLQGQEKEEKAKQNICLAVYIGLWMKKKKNYNLKVNVFVVFFSPFYPLLNTRIWTYRSRTLYSKPKIPDLEKTRDIRLKQRHIHGYEWTTWTICRKGLFLPSFQKQIVTTG